VQDVLSADLLLRNQKIRICIVRFDGYLGVTAYFFCPEYGHNFSKCQKSSARIHAVTSQNAVFFKIRKTVILPMLCIRLKHDFSTKRKDMG
jgi:hypothetical protein